MNRRKFVMSAALAPMAVGGATRARAAGEWELTPLDGVRVKSASPNGAYFAGWSRARSFVIWDAHSFEAISTVNQVPEAAATAMMVNSWNPADSSLAWDLHPETTEVPLLIYGLRIGSEELDILTDMDPDLATKPPDSFVPHVVERSPCWSIDGSELRFSRELRDSNAEWTSIMNCKADGSVETFAEVADYRSRGILSALWNQPDGSVMAMSVISGDDVVIATFAPDRDPQPIVMREPPEGSLFSVSDMTNDGTRMLLIDSNVGVTNGTWLYAPHAEHPWRLVRDELQLRDSQGLYWIPELNRETGALAAVPDGTRELVIVDSDGTRTSTRVPEELGTERPTCRWSGNDVLVGSNLLPAFWRR